MHGHAGAYALKDVFENYGFLGVLRKAAKACSKIAVSGRGFASRETLLVWLLAVRKTKAQAREIPLFGATAKCVVGRRLGGTVGGLCLDEAPRNRKFRTFKSLDIKKVQETENLEQGFSRVLQGGFLKDVRTRKERAEHRRRSALSGQAWLLPF